MLERHREAGSVSSLGSSAGTTRSAGLVSMACRMGSVGSAGTALGAWGQGWSFSGNGWLGATNQGQTAIVGRALSRCRGGRVPLHGPPHGIRAAGRQHNGASVASESGHAPHLPRVGQRYSRPPRPRLYGLYPKRHCRRL